MTRTTRILIAALLVTGFASRLTGQSANPPISPSAHPTIVLVHGAFADGSSWSKVIPILQHDGYTVIAVQNPLTSLDADVETTKRALAMQTGPVVLVGHSYGGAVITQAAAGNANVKALVYVAAFAPEVGEPIGAFGQQYPAPLGAALKQDPSGFLYIDPVKFHEVFAADLPVAETNVAAAVQKPIIGSVFGASVTEAAWKTIPSWYLVSQDDKAINPDLERFYAKRMKAKTTEVKASHVAFLSHPAVVAKVIEEAAAGAH